MNSENMIDVSEIRKFYDEKYSAMLENTFPCDIVRFESWLDGVLPMVGRQSRVLDVGCGAGYVCSYLEGILSWERSIVRKKECVGF